MRWLWTIDISLITENTRSCFYLPGIFVLNLSSQTTKLSVVFHESAE